ncbi:hypothetical protein CRE_19264 [Caenorhabditis remanei]|uniref:Uncharacterized protein n=1 Tax=Caenorhabditis remanei TaxID=31234 RepID=E3MJR9_CAERE|nr:hypothetical protein CRE_19264 [Caenorhabditis remanei]
MIAKLKKAISDKITRVIRHLFECDLSQPCECQVRPDDYYVSADPEAKAVYRLHDDPGVIPHSVLISWIATGNVHCSIFTTSSSIAPIGSFTNARSMPPPSSTIAVSVRLMIVLSAPRPVLLSFVSAKSRSLAVVCLPDMSANHSKRPSFKSNNHENFNPGYRFDYSSR